MYHAYPRRRKSGIILPFLLLVVIALTAVFAFQVWSYFRAGREQKTENKAAVTVVSGNVEMKLYGESNWVRSPTGSILREGDSLKTLSGSRVSLSLLNGSYVRLDGDSEINVLALRSYEGQDALSLGLPYGELWLRKTKSDIVKTAFSVVMEDVTVRSTGTVFAVRKRDDTRIHVVEGNVEFDVKEKVEGKERVFETIKVGVGQEARMTDEDLIKFRQRKSPEIIFALSDVFKTSDWYGWNSRQDATPTVATLTVAEAVEQEKPIQFTPGPEPAPEASVSVVLPSPEVIEPDTAHRRFKTDRVIMRGKTSEKTQKMIVKTFVAGKEDTYTLQKYEAGKAEWTYIAAVALGNLVPGNNRYEILAEDEKGKRSEPAELVLVYEKEKTPADFSAPQVLTFNGQASNETVEEAVRVEGTIGKGIVKVIVNDFELTRYVLDSGKWVYYAKVPYGNLKEGENEFTIFGMDADGKKTSVTKFTIVKLPKPAEE